MHTQMPALHALALYDLQPVPAYIKTIPQRGGNETFRKELLEQAQNRAGENHSAEIRRETAEEKARRIMDEELAKLGWQTLDLAGRAKGDIDKVRIARRLRTETSVTLKWIAEQ